MASFTNYVKRKDKIPIELICVQLVRVFRMYSAKWVDHFHKKKKLNEECQTANSTISGIRNINGVRNIYV